MIIQNTSSPLKSLYIIGGRILIVLNSSDLGAMSPLALLEKYQEKFDNKVLLQFLTFKMNSAEDIVIFFHESLLSLYENSVKKEVFEKSTKEIDNLMNQYQKAISENDFAYDENINLNKKHKIYSILLLSDRLLEIPGINYILSKWLHNNL